MKIQNKEDLLKWMLQAKYLWLFLDYDGTLADFAPTPDHIVPDPVVIQLLEQLAKIPSVRITVISGRRLKDIQTLLPVKRIFKAGTYGIELIQPTDEVTYRVEYENIRPHLDVVKPQWEQLIQNKNGFFLEDKGWTLALHARFANDTDAGDVIAKAKNIASNELPRDIFHILGGHKFLEIAPKLANKKDSVSYLLEEFPLPEAELLYFGDDDKDENAFPVIHSHQGYAVKVIHPAQESKPTTADVILHSPAETIQWLGRFLQLKKQIDH